MPNIAEEAPAAGWSGLLSAMSNDELVRYGQIALDQYRRELRYWWAQGLLGLAAVGGAAIMLRGLVLWGYSGSGLLTLGLSALMGYWPYRSAKTRKLWWGHYTAVLEEQMRRLSDGPRG
jgi:hypothetical protein